MIDTKTECVCGRRKCDPPNADCERCQLRTVRADFRKYETWSENQIHSLHERLVQKSQFISELLAERNRLAIETNHLRAGVAELRSLCKAAVNLLRSQGRSEEDLLVVTLCAAAGFTPSTPDKKESICNE